MYIVMTDSEKSITHYLNFQYRKDFAQGYSSMFMTRTTTLKYPKGPTSPAPNRIDWTPLPQKPNSKHQTHNLKQL